MHPTTAALLSVLADLDEGALSDCYGITRTSGAPLDIALFAWIDAGRPDLGPVTPEAPADYTGPCHIEVSPEWRSGRGRYWRPNGEGYTDDIARAGVFSVERARTIASQSERTIAVKARPVPEVAGG